MKQFIGVLIPFLLFGCASTKNGALDFNADNYTVETAEVNGKTITFRAYKNIVYVENPVDTKYQSLNFYVPAAYYEKKSVGNYTAENAPVFFPNNVGGYMPAEAGLAQNDRRSGKPNAILVALSKGFVVASPGARGRTLKDETGKYYGKAPAVIVDLKSAVRYLKYNDKKMAGDAKKIISNGTSAGGAVSTLLGASGNNKDYEPYLKELGAANASDDIFAVSAYCPITNLDNADIAYEWQYGEAKEYKKISMEMLDYNVQRKEISGTLSANEIAVSDKLKALFPDYINSLNLKDANGNALTLGENGNGSFRELVVSYIIASAQKALDSGKDLSAFSWLTIQNNKVIAMDFPQYVQYTKRMKLPPAFDALDLTSGENDLFGTEEIPAQHFTKFGLENSTKQSTAADVQIVKMMNPMNYIGTKNTATSKHWRIRHGTVDKDGSLAIPVLLAAKLQNAGYDVNLELPWEVPHSGDYDLDELFEWIDEIVK